ncbi:unnamed protein product [Brassica oleracea]
MRKPQRGLAKTRLRSSMADVPAAILPLLVAAFVDRPPWPLLKRGTRPLTLPRPPNMTFNQKVGYIGGTYMNGYYAQPQPQPQYYTTTITCMVEDELWLGQVRRCLSTLSISLSCHQSQAIGFPQASFTKPNSTHPISGILSFYPKSYNVS